MKKVFFIAAFAVTGVLLASCTTDNEAMFEPTQKQNETVFQNPYEGVYAKDGDTIPPNVGGGDTGGDGTLPIKPPKKP
ncbi:MULTISPECIES: hypothetical protein [unclassified Flavobacterium]|uniref:hypothetical protein n=1 Tax=unclassified Flavobacterium TaxID=196869 RepID=UPI00095E5472|nr:MULTISPECIES: hypothetical protein [unclassified Flavobacterium]MBN9286258.1 hypothetical protein [Flavobacterium sp.]OJV73781.1 MAG: hypothetical protein BGO42_14735 [Flavobacterium sp. 40-81]